MHAPDPATFIAAGASAQVYRLEGGRVLKLFHAGIDPSIVAREYAIARVVQASGLIFACTYVVLNLTADILSILANPRLRHPK